MADTRRKSLGRPVLYALIVLGVYLTYRIFSPFFAALTWAAIFAILCHGVQARLAAKMGPGRAALVTTLGVGLLIVAPAVVLISSVVRQVPQITDGLNQTPRSVPPQLQRTWDAVRSHSPVALPANPRDVVTRGAQRAINFLASRAGAFAADFFATLGSLVTMLFALFFLVRNGDAITRQLRDRLPFPEEQSDSLLRETRDLVVASVGAGLVVAAAQGTIGGLSFWLVGIPAPAFWGLVMGFASLLPVVGATLVWVPASIGLLLSGEIGRGILLFVLGAVGISGIDNVLRPLLLTGKTSISGFVIFFGLLGGAAAFGFLGLVIGPIVVVITARLFEMLHHPNLLEAPAATDAVIAEVEAR